MFTGHQDSNMAKVVSCIKSEWHQVERQYGIEIDLQYVRDLFLEHGETEEGCQAIFDKLVSGEMDGGDLEDYGYETYPDSFFSMDWDWLDKDDWWTDRKGGYDVTYKQEVIETEPSTPNDEATVAKVDKRTESEKLQDDLEPIYHPTQHDESDAIEDAKEAEPISTDPEFVKNIKDAKEAFKGWADE